MSIDQYIKKISTENTVSGDDVKSVISTLRQCYTMEYICLMYAWYGYGMLKQLVCFSTEKGYKELKV